MRGTPRPADCKEHGGHAPGSYCLAICYCGHCPQYVPPPEPSYKSAIRTYDPTTDRSWDTEEED